MADAQRLADDPTFRWHQRLALAPGVYSPGDNDVEHLMAVAQVPADLTGLSVLDVGTSNGGVCWEAERRGAVRVVGADIATIDHCGWDRLRDYFGSRAEFVNASIYDLPEALGGERFDLVFFWGVLYHLRHPLLGLDNLRRLTKRAALIETAVCDAELPRRGAGLALTRFYRHDELEPGNDSNWFAPSTDALLDWCGSSGFEAELLGAWPRPLGTIRLLTVGDRLRARAERRPWVPVPRLARPGERSAKRAMVRAVPTEGEPEYREVSWAEGPLTVRGPES